jgi:hypothetical protein
MSPVSVREVTVAFEAVPVFDGLSFTASKAKHAASRAHRLGGGAGEGGRRQGVWTPIDATRSRQPWN